MGLFGEPATSTHELELENVALRTRLDVATDTETELRDRVRQLELTNDRLLRRILRLSRPPVGAPATATLVPSGPTPAPGPMLGGKTLRAIQKYSGGDKKLAQHLMNEALSMLAEDPELTDVAIAARIIEGEDPERLDEDDVLGAERGRVIPGGSGE